MIKYERIDNIATIETKYDEIQINYMKWGNNTAKYDIRKWNSEGEPMKGFTLTESELEQLYAALKEHFDPDENEDEMEESVNVIDFRSFVVHSDMNSCISQGHDFKDLKAYVDVYSSNDGMKEIQIDACFCKDCNAYYIDEAVYNSLKFYGKIMCQLFSKKMFDNMKKYNNFDNLSIENIVHAIGYHVGKEDELSEDERHVILAYAISTGLVTKKQVIGHLGFLIKLNEMKSNMEDSVKKWRADRAWLVGGNSVPYVKAKRIVLNNTFYPYCEENDELPFA